MRRLFRSFLSKILAVCADVWTLFPILLTLHISAFQGMLFYTFAGALVGAYLFAMVLRRLLIRKNRLLSIAISLAACIGLGIQLGIGIGGKVAVALLSFVAACRGIAVVEQPFRIAFPRTYCFVSLFLYFFAYILYGRIVVLREYQVYIFYAGLVAVPFTLLLINMDVLMEASRAELKESTSMPIVKRNNRILTVLTVLLGAFAASYNTLKDAFVHAVQSAFLFLLGLIDRIMDYLYTPIQGGGIPGEQQQMPQLPQAEEAPSSPFWDKVVLAVGTVIFYAVLIAFIILLGIVLIRLIRRLIQLIRRLMEDFSWSGESYGFSDEKESLIDWQSIRQSYSDSIREWLERIFQNEPRWSQLTDNRQRVRYLYRHLVLRAIASGYAFRASRTPGETLHDLAEHERLDKSLQHVLQALYGKARYGNSPIADTDVEELKKGLKL